MARDEGCWSPRPASWASRTSPGCWPIGSSWPTPTGPRPPTRRRRPLVMSSWTSSYLGHVAGPDDPRPDQRRHRRERAQPPRARLLRGRLCRGQGAPGPDRAGSTSWPAPRASAGPTPSSRWPPAAAPPRPRASAPPRSSASWSASRPSTGASVSSRTATVLASLGPRRRGWTRPTSSGPSSRSGTRIDVSVRSRLFTGGTRRAIELRDRIAPTPTATSRPRTARSTTSRPMPQGGETTQENGRLLCGFHNRLRNQRERQGDQRQRPPPSAA